MNIRAMSAALACGVCVIAFAAPAEAQARGFKINGGDLRSALEQYVEQSGVQLVYRIDDVARARSQGVKGVLAPEVALRTLLAGSGFEERRDVSGAVAIVPSREPRRKRLTQLVPHQTALKVAATNFQAADDEVGPTAEVVPPATEVTSAAAEASPADSEIIVTARRINERLQDVPISVTAISGETVQKLAIYDPQDLKKFSTLTIQPVSSQPFSLGLRGQGQGALTNQPSVILYFAEVPSFPLSFLDLENIQLLKGPQGTLFGETATAGALLLTPRKPTNDFNGYASVHAGTRGYWQFEGAIGGALIEDKLAVRLAVRRRERNGWVTGFISSRDGAPTDLNNIDQTEWRLSVLAKPTNNLENYTIVTGIKDESHGRSAALEYADPQFLPPFIRTLVPASDPFLAAAYEFWSGQAPPPGQSWGDLLVSAQAEQTALGPRRVRVSFDPRYKSKFFGLVNQTRWDITEHLAVRNIFGVGWTTQWGGFYDFDGSALPLLDSRGLSAPGSTLPGNGGLAKRGGPRSATYTEEFQLVGSLFKERIKWQAGVYYRERGTRKWEANQGFLAIFAFPAGEPGSPETCAALQVASPCSLLSRDINKTKAIYGQATFAVTDALNLTAGYRRTRDYARNDTTATAANIVTFKGFPMFLPTVGRKRSPGAGITSLVVPWSSASSYNLTADYRISDNLLVYVAHRRGYKGGGINAIVPVGDPDRAFGPETIKDVELGLKSNWSALGLRGMLNVAAYQNWYSDIQRSSNIPGRAQTFTTNLADAKIKGIEFDGAISLGGWLQISGVFSYIDAKYTRWTENRVCATQFALPMCNGLPATTPVVVDHVNGTLSVAGQTIRFTPDLFAEAPKWSWSVTPTVNFRDWIGHDVSLSTTISHQSVSAASSVATNYSAVAGIPPRPQQTYAGFAATPPVVRDSFTRIDVRAEWRSVLNSNFSLALQATNIDNRIQVLTSAGAITNVGAKSSQIGEPRMVWVELKYNF